MASLIGEMKYLTIGDSIYEIPDAPLDSPAFTGTPTAPTAASGTSTTQIATTAFVQNAMSQAGAGTVTSVQVQATSPVQSSISTAQTSTLNTTISLASGYGDTQNPYASKTANYVLAAPNGSAGTPSFRALVEDDIPDLSSTYAAAADIPTITLNGTTTTSPSFYAPSSAGTSGYVLTSSGSGAPTWAAASSDTFYVTYTKDSSSNWTCDSTFSTLYAAYTAGKQLIAHIIDNNLGGEAYITVYNLNNQVSSTVIFFQGTFGYNATQDYTYYIEHWSNDDIVAAIYTINRGTDTKMSWSAATTSNTYYPLQSTSTAATSTANTLNGVSFYQYYNTSGGYRRLDLGNSTSYTSSGGAYGAIRLYGTGSYYTDLYPGTTTANRTLTLPNATGTVALTSDIPDTIASATTGISISDHSTASIYGVSSTTTTATNTTLGTAFTIPNVTAVGSGSFTQGTDTFTQGTDSFTAASLSSGFYTAGSAASFSQGSDSFTQGTDSFTAASLGSGFYTAGSAASFSQGTDTYTQGTFTAGSLTMAVNGSDSNQLDITFTAPTHASDSFTQGSDSFTANTPTTIDTTKFNGGSFTQGSDSFTQGSDSFTTNTPTVIDTTKFSGGSFTQGTDTFTQGTDTHTHTAPTLGTAFTVPNVTGNSSVTVPIKNSSSTTVVTSATHTITDGGHTHTLG